MAWLWCFFIVGITCVSGAAAPALASVHADSAYERAAYRLELVRNQIELTIANHRSLASDVHKQERELQGMRVYEHVPLASSDFKSDRALLDAIKSEFQRAAELDSGFSVKKIEFASPWRTNPKRIPSEVGFDSEYQILESQIIDRRDLRVTLAFKESLPLDPSKWFERQRNNIKRLLVSVRWMPQSLGHARKPASLHGARDSRSKELVGVVSIFRFRDFEYPKLLAPDLAQYSTPSQPATEMQRAAYERMSRYRRDIAAMWPEAESYLDKIREFARNDLRMNFFLEHANIENR